MADERRTYTLRVLGRTLEHLGTQMYKRRDTAIAELVANAWDAGAPSVSITLPDPRGYDPAASEIVIEDTGVGMDPDAVQDEYLVVGRNRRAEGSPAPEGRIVMGRKGIGKLAGFGIAEKLELVTRRDGHETVIRLDAEQLKAAPNSVEDVVIEGLISDARTAGSGTRLSLRALKHLTPVDEDELLVALGRRFSRSVRGLMAITVNGRQVEDPEVTFESRQPSEGLEEADLPDGSKVRFYYGFADKPIRWTQLRGFTIHVNGKTAQAPPYFFDVEGTASGQHGTRYLSGAIEADYIDAGTDDESDIISTDRQEIDWEAETSRPLHEWGAEITRRALREWANRKEDRSQRWVEEDEALATRIGRLDRPSQQQVVKWIRTLGQSDADRERIIELAGALVAAFEYRHFHDLIGAIEAVEDDPDALETLLAHLSEWKVLESRAILEVVKGRLEILDKFRAMVVGNAPETAPAVGMDNVHDLIAGYPWLINPEWQVLAEEKGTTTQLREWGERDTGEAPGGRYDFLALVGDGSLRVIEIKRSGIAVTLEEAQSLERYKRDLSRAHSEVGIVLVSSGDYQFDAEAWRNRADLLTWREVVERARIYYEHYRAVLVSDLESPDFHRKEVEVARTREVITHGTYRGREARRKGLGTQDVEAREFTPDSASTKAPAADESE
jgi:hypothetical protein